MDAEPHHAREGRSGHGVAVVAVVDTDGESTGPFLPNKDVDFFLSLQSEPRKFSTPFQDSSWLETPLPPRPPPPLPPPPRSHSRINSTTDLSGRLRPRVVAVPSVLRRRRTASVRRAVVVVPRLIAPSPPPQEEEEEEEGGGRRRSPRSLCPWTTVKIEVE